MIYFRGKKEYSEFFSNRLEYSAKLFKNRAKDRMVSVKDGLVCFAKESTVDHKRSITYYRVDEFTETVVSWCVLKNGEWVGKEVLMLFVDPDYRGKGEALSLYDEMLKDGILLMSGWSHNPMSMNLWAKLVKNKRYTTWAQDLKDLNKVSTIEVEEDQFDCDLTLYRNKESAEDVRIIAFNPKYVKKKISKKRPMRHHQKQI